MSIDWRKVPGMVDAAEALAAETRAPGLDGVHPDPSALRLVEAIDGLVAIVRSYEAESARYMNDATRERCASYDARMRSERAEQEVRRLAETALAFHDTVRALREAWAIFDAMGPASQEKVKAVGRIRALLKTEPEVCSGCGLVHGNRQGQEPTVGYRPGVGLVLCHDCAGKLVARIVR